MSEVKEIFMGTSRAAAAVIGLSSEVKGDRFAEYDAKLDPYFCPGTGKFYEKVGNRYAEKTIESFATSCRAIGVSILKTNGNTVVAEYLKHIEDTRTVDRVGRLAGLKAGVVESDGHRILVTEDQYLLAPKQGDWSMIDKFIDIFMGAEQKPYFLAWHALVFRSMFTGKWKPNQLLVLAGGANCGKSFWQHQVLSRILGSSQSPYMYLAGQTTFNGELATAAHLEMADVGSRPTDKQRMDFGNMVKKYTVDRIRHIHPKGKQGYSVPLMQCMSLSVNAKASHLSVLPPLASDIEDKIMLFRCGQAALPTNFGMAKDDQHRMEQTFAAQVPAFLFYLLYEHVIEDSIHEERFGVKAYADQGLKDSIESVSSGSASDLLELIDIAHFDGETRDEDTLTAGGWLRVLMNHELTKDMVRAVCPSTNRLASILSGLVGIGEEGETERVTRHEGRGNKLRWTIRRSS